MCKRVRLDLGHMLVQFLHTFEFISKRDLKSKKRLKIKADRAKAHQTVFLDSDKACGKLELLENNEY